MNQVESFEQFMKERDEASKAFVNGDAAPLGRIVTHTSPATFFGPDGGLHKGPDDVLSTYEQSASHFVTGESQLETLHMGASGDIAYWVGFQRAKGRLDGSKETVPLDLRVTEIYHREGDKWKLIHRHADTLVNKKS